MEMLLGMFFLVIFGLEKGLSSLYGMIFVLYWFLSFGLLLYLLMNFLIFFILLLNFLNVVFIMGFFSYDGFVNFFMYFLLGECDESMFSVVIILMVCICVGSMFSSVVFGCFSNFFIFLFWFVFFFMGMFFWMVVGWFGKYLLKWYCLKLIVEWWLEVIYMMVVSVFVSLLWVLSMGYYGLFFLLLWFMLCILF